MDSDRKDKIKGPDGADNKKISQLAPGMTIRVHEKINDIDAKGKERTRIQVFEGIVLALKNVRSAGASVLVRKTSANNIGVEKIYPLRSPLVDKIDIVKSIKTRRAKLYFLPVYKKRLKAKTNSQD